MAGSGAVDQLKECLARLPGIGPKTSERLAYHLLQVEEGQAAIDVVLGNTDHESQVAAHHPIPGFGVSQPNLDRQLALALLGQEWVLIDIPEVCLESDFAGAHSRLLSAGVTGPCTCTAPRHAFASASSPASSTGRSPLHRRRLLGFYRTPRVGILIVCKRLTIDAKCPDL